MNTQDIMKNAQIKIKYDDIACTLLDGVEFKDKKAIAKAVVSVGNYLRKQAEADQKWTDEDMKASQDLLDRAAGLIGNPGTNISGSTDIACISWQKEYEQFKLSRP